MGVEPTIVRREEGEDPIAPSVGAAKKLMVPLLVSSLTTAAAFTPIALAESDVREFTSSIFYVVTIALLLSWALSMTFVPVMTPFVKVNLAKKGKDIFSGPLYGAYRAALGQSLRFPFLFLLLVVSMFDAAIYGMGYVQKVFNPASEDPILSTTIKFPSGASIELQLLTGIEALDGLLLIS